MPKFNIKRKYPHSADQIFAVASDVASYSQFVPLVRASRVWDRKKLEDGRISFKALLTITYKRLDLKETLQSDMVVDPQAKTISATSAYGILKRLNSVWKVYDLPDGGSEVEMDFDYEMNSKMMQVLVSSVFDLALRRIANALGERVEELYVRKSVTA
jgi:coenzyme Q-binding protein COQ10